MPPLPSSTLTPQFSLSEVFGGPGTSSGAAPMRVLSYGAMVGTLITATVNTSGSTTQAYTTAAGTATAGVPSQAFSAADAAAQWGTGSELAMDAAAAFAQDPNCTFWGAPVTESVGARATGVLTPTTGPATAPGTLRVIVCGRFVDVAISTGDTNSVIGANVATAINQQGAWPVTAQNVWATGAVTITAKNKGPRGNYITFRAILMSATASAKATAGNLAVTLIGETITLSGGTATGGVYVLSGGTTDDVWTTALAAVVGTPFDRHAAPAYLVAGTPSTNPGLLAAQLDTAGGLPSMFAQQAVLGCSDSLGNATTTAIGLNDARSEVVWHRFADDTPGEIAAATAAGRLAGDGAVVPAGVPLVGEAADPSANLNGLELALRVQDVLTDRPLATEIETALHNGISPVQPSSARPGGVALVAAITSRSVDASDLPSLSVFKCKSVGVTDAVRAGIVQDLRTTYRGFRLVAATSDGLPPKQPRTVDPPTVRTRVYTDLKGYEAVGWITGVDATADALTTVINGTNPRRLDMVVPCAPSDDFDIAAGQIEQLS